MDKEKTIQEILKIFKEIALPCEADNIKTPLKENKIIELLKSKYPQIKYNKETGILIPAKTKNSKKLIITSHYDLIPSFNKGFKNQRAPFTLNENKIKGALDNTITNAVLIYLLLNFNMPENVEIIFTNMEEIGCIGMRNYLLKIEKENIEKEKLKKDLFFINLDVTNECWKEKVSLEMDYPIYEIIHFLKDEIKGMTTEREGDDLCEVIEFGYKGFSFCLPTKKTIHSWKNRTTTEHLYQYTEKLLFLIQNSDKILELSQNETFNYLSIDDILKLKKEEAIKQEEEKEKQHKTLNQYYYDYGFYDYEEFDETEIEKINQIEKYIDDVNNELYACFSDEIPEEKFEMLLDELNNILYDSIFSGQDFEFEELTFNIEDQETLDLAKKILDHLSKTGYLIKNKVKFDDKSFIVYTPII